MLRLGEVDLAICGGVSESIHTFGIFAGFKSQGALATNDVPAKASRPFDRARNGIVVSEGGCLYTLERLDDALARGARIYGEIAGYGILSDASDYVLPNPVRQAECIRKAIAHAGLTAAGIHIVNTHATATTLGDIQECEAIRAVFGEGCPDTHINNTKSFIGHCMGAAGALELAGNLPSFDDLVVHPTINVDDLDPACALPGLVLNAPVKASRVDTILNNSFGMLGINSTLIVTAIRGITGGAEPLMTNDECKKAVLDIIADIAPDEDLSSVKPDLRLRDQLQLDSMDFLDIVMELRKRHGIEVPEADYTRLASLDSCAEYLTPKFNALAAKS
jgi:acyl carrier protein